MLNSIVLAALGSLAAADPEITYSAPGYYVQGESFVVEVTYRAGAEEASLEAWRFGPGTFEVDGKPLADRGDDHGIPLPAGSVVTLTLDLKASLSLSKSFSLNVTGSRTGAREVGAFEPAPEGLEFLTMPQDELDDYNVLLETSHGTMLLEFWPELAPNHVRNFLDLSYTGFYDGTQFHRVSPNFMIQGGCPNTKSDNRNSWGLGRGPRMLDPEFSDTPHERGVLSMARGPSPNSASSQFFVMTARNAGLDNKYSVFGEMISGDPTLEKIANAKGKTSRDGTTRPDEPQRLEKAQVLKPVQGS